MNKILTREQLEDVVICSRIQCAKCSISVALKQAREALEIVTESLENCYGREIPDTENARAIIDAIDELEVRE